MTHWLPQPRLSGFLLITWLLLQNSISAGQFTLGMFLAIAIPLFSARFWPEPLTIHRHWILLRFVLRVLWDIIRANLQVATVLLSPTPRLRPCFIEYPLRLRNEFTIFILANTISLTPGTVTAELDLERHQLLIHCLDLDDEKQLIEQIGQRYEMPLQEVFESC